MPVTKMLVPCEIETPALSCDSCQATLYAPLNPWVTLAEFRIRRVGNDSRSMRFRVQPEIPEQQVVELAMRQGWKVVEWCGRRRLVCKGCGALDKHESSAVRSH